MPTHITRFAVAMAACAAAVTTEGREPSDVATAPLPAIPDAAPTLAGPTLARLVWADPSGVAIGIEGMARKEVESVMRTMGVAVSWRRWRTDEILERRDDEICVILVDRGAMRAPGTPILGATPLRSDVARVVWVHVPGVRATLGLPARASASGADFAVARALALALGRVIAHEVVHALAPTVPHGTGLMSERFTRAQLTAARLAVDPAVGVAVRAALGRGPFFGPAEPTILAAEGAGKEIER